MNSFIPVPTNAECGEQRWIEAAGSVTIAVNRSDFVCLLFIWFGQSAFCGLSFSVLWLD